MQYSYDARNSDKDLIYKTRLQLIRKLNFDVNKTGQRYRYYMRAYLGIIIVD